MNRINTISLVTLLVIASFGLVLATPNGANAVTEEASSTAGPTSAQSHDALAGNVTELTVYGDSVTLSWQGYFGNVSGAIRLADSSGDPMYNWSIASPSGEVFASTASSITWSSIECFNWTADGAALETTFNINDSADGVNETFSDSNLHSQFYVGSTNFIANACMSTYIFDSSGTSTSGSFEEVLLHDGTNAVFASLLEDDLSGFDSKSHDFEMLVLEDGHDGDSSTTPYFFYIELE